MIVAGFGMTYLICPSCSQSLNHYLRVSAFSSSLWVFLWLGNAEIGNYVGNKSPWEKYPYRSFAIGMAVTLFYTLAAVYLIVAVFDRFFRLQVLDDLQDIAFNSVVVTLVISLFMHGRSFLLSWRAEALNSERLKKENAIARYDSLKSQVNPHFLFNSLNALTNLVYEDQDKAAKFIKQLSEVYRYVLDTRNSELVHLKEELGFLNAYLYLQQIRYGEKLHVRIELDQCKTGVAPLALQMLIENAIKHNVIAEEQPLHIRLYCSDGFIIVENNLQRKKILEQDSAGIGLENIKRRYEFLSDKSVQVIEELDTFKVMLPVLEAE